MSFSRIYIEISNICNLKCHFCPEVERAQQKMSTQEFEHILSKIKNHTPEICMHVMGEPLAHPEFSKFVQIAGQNEFKVQITTNASLINRPEIQKSLLEPHIRQINFSVQSFSANSKNTENPDLVESKLEAYLKPIFEFCTQAQKQRPDLYLQFRIWDQDQKNQNDLESIVNSLLIQKLESFFKVKVDFSKVDLKFKKTFPLGGRASIHFDTRFEWPKMPACEMHSGLNKQGFCYALKSHIAILTDGSVVPCCLDKERNLLLGQIHTQNLDEILSSQRANQMREGFKKRELVEKLCQNCDFIKRFS